MSCLQVEPEEQTKGTNEEPIIEATMTSKSKRKIDEQDESGKDTDRNEAKRAKQEDSLVQEGKKRINWVKTKAEVEEWAKKAEEMNLTFKSDKALFDAMDQEIRTDDWNQSEEADGEPAYDGNVTSYISMNKSKNQQKSALQEEVSAMDSYKYKYLYSSCDISLFRPMLAAEPEEEVEVLQCCSTCCKFSYRPSQIDPNKCDSKYWSAVEDDGEFDTVQLATYMDFSFRHECISSLRRLFKEAKENELSFLYCVMQNCAKSGSMLKILEWNYDKKTVQEKFNGFATWFNLRKLKFTLRLADFASRFLRHLFYECSVYSYKFKNRSKKTVRKYFEGANIGVVLIESLIPFMPKFRKDLHFRISNELAIDILPWREDLTHLLLVTVAWKLKRGIVLYQREENYRFEQQCLVIFDDSDKEIVLTKETKLDESNSFRRYLLFSSHEFLQAAKTIFYLKEPNLSNASQEILDWLKNNKT